MQIPFNSTWKKEKVGVHPMWGKTSVWQTHWRLILYVHMVRRVADGCQEAGDDATHQPVAGTSKISGHLLRGKPHPWLIKHNGVLIFPERSISYILLYFTRKEEGIIWKLFLRRHYLSVTPRSPLLMEVFPEPSPTETQTAFKHQQHRWPTILFPRNC